MIVGERGQLVIHECLEVVATRAYVIAKCPQTQKVEYAVKVPSSRRVFSSLRLCVFKAAKRCCHHDRRSGLP